MQREVEAQLQAKLLQAGFDYLRFVHSLGISFKPGPDRLSTLKRARQAALLQLHPDKLSQRDERGRALGLRATQMLNAMWQQQGAV